MRATLHCFTHKRKKSDARLHSDYIDDQLCNDSKQYSHTSRIIILGKQANHLSYMLGNESSGRHTLVNQAK